MQNIIFEKLQLKNFRAHSELQVDLEESKLIAIVGPNGAGKSSIAMAIRTALYGDPGDDLDISDLVNNIIGKNMEIHLFFRIDDIKYKIERYYNHSRKQNGLFLLKRNLQGEYTENISDTTVPATYKKIEQMILPKEVFCNTIYFAQQVKDFFTALNDSTQKRIFNAILGLDEYGNYYNKINTFVSSFENEKLKVNEVVLKNETSKSEKENILQKLKQDLELAKKEKDDKINLIKKEIIIEKEELEKIEIKLASEEFDDEFLEENQQKLINLINKQEKILENKEREKKDIESKFENFKTNIINQCTLILQQMMDGAKTDFNEYKTDLDKKILSNQSKITSISNEYATKIKDKQNQIAIEINKNNGIIQNLNNEIIKLKSSQQLRDLQNNLNQKCLEISKNRNELEKEIKIEENQINLHGNSILKCETDIQKLTDSINTDNKICPTCGQDIKDTKHILNEIQKIQQSLVELVGKKETCSTKLIKLRSELSNFDEEAKLIISDVEKKIHDLELTVQVQIDNRNLKINELNKVIQELNNSLNEVINQLEKEKSDSTSKLIQENNIFNSNIEAEREEVKRKFNLDQAREKEKMNKLILEEEQNKSNQAKDIDSKYNSDSEKYSKEKVELEKIISDLKEIKKQIDNLKNDLKIKVELINRKKEEFSKLENEKFDDSNIKKYENDLKEIEIEREINRTSLNKLNRKLQIAEFWKESFSNRGIPSMLIDENIPFMNKTIKKELEKVSPGTFTVSFDTMSQNKAGDLKEKFKVNILHNIKKTNKHKALSGGERRLIDVCCMRTLRKLVENLYQKRINLSMLDEVLDSLDTNNGNLFCYYLKKLAQNEHIMLITHDQTKVSEADDVLRMG